MQCVPAIFVYDDKGERLLAFRNAAAAKDREGRVVAGMKSGESYLLAIGAVDGASKGEYHLHVEEIAPPKPSLNSKK
jgi:hypothetical protein